MAKSSDSKRPSSTATDSALRDGVARRYCPPARSWGRPTFSANKIFAFVGSSMDRPHSVVFRPDPDERPAYLQDERFFVPPYWGTASWLGIDIEADSPERDWTELAELIDMSYRQVAFKRQVAALDGLSRPPEGLPAGRPRAG